MNRFVVGFNWLSLQLYAFRSSFPSFDPKLDARDHKSNGIYDNKKNLIAPKVCKYISQRLMIIPSIANIKLYKSRTLSFELKAETIALIENASDNSNNPTLYTSHSGGTWPT